MLVETTGALGAAFMTILRILAKQTRLPGATDLTQYGEGRASTKAFLTHHVANISAVVQASDALGTPDLSADGPQDNDEQTFQSVHIFPPISA